MANDAVPVPRSDVIHQYGHRGALDPFAVPEKSNDGGFLAQVSVNPFFTAGLGLAGFGAILAVAQKGVRHGASLVKRRLLVDVEINVKDESYPWFLYWMTVHQRSQLPSFSRSTTPSPGKLGRPGLIESLMRRFTPGIHHLSIETEKVEHPNGSVQTEFTLIPGPGKHIIRYRNAFLVVNRLRETRSMNHNTGIPWETITLTTLYSQRNIFEDIFSEAHQLAQQFSEGKTIVYQARATSWEKFGEPRRKRPLESVILDKGIKERILSDVKGFLGSAKWYYDRGIPYRRGYLLHGPPGSGKSSFIRALAGELDYNIAMLNLSERGLTDDRLNHLLTIIPRRTLVLLEDADAAFGNRRTQTDDDGYRGANVTFSGLLNALDGVASAEERIVFLTTNYVDRLDSALIRPGRVDMAVRLGEATRWQMAQMWNRFYGEFDVQGIFKARFLERLEQLGLINPETEEKRLPAKSTSAAAVQGLFLYNKGDMEGAIGMAPGLVPEGQEGDNVSASETKPLG